MPSKKPKPDLEFTPKVIVTRLEWDAALQLEAFCRSNVMSRSKPNRTMIALLKSIDAAREAAKAAV